MAGYDSVQAEVGAFLRHYAAALDLPCHVATFAEAIAPAAWDAFPRGSRLHKPAVFAEVLAFHAIKAAGLPIDQDAFRRASLVGNMAMIARPWLLRYQQHIPPALRVASREPSPEAWFARMPPGPVIDAARTIMATEAPRLAAMRLGTRTGVAVVTAWKCSGISRSGGASLGTILATAGINLSSAYNAAVRAGLIVPRSTRASVPGDAVAVA